VRSSDPPPPPSTAKADETRAVESCSSRSRVADLAVAVSVDGDVRLWKISDATCRWRQTLSHPCAPVTAVWADCAAPASTPSVGGKSQAPAVHIYCGLDDGSLRCIEAATAAPLSAPPFPPPSAAGTKSAAPPVEVWTQRAHKGAITAMTGNAAVVVTAGADGRCCVWSRKARDMLLQFSEHLRPVCGIALDCSASDLLHSVGADGAVNTYRPVGRSLSPPRCLLLLISLS
jgi:WD40 repeat protein